MSAKNAAGLRPEILDFRPYAPGLSIDEIRERYGLRRVIKLASNENPLGASPLVLKAIERRSPSVFRYPQSGNPRLRKALAAHYGVPEARIAIGNGSDELIDLLVRLKARPGRDNVLAFRPCFSIYGLQARFCGVEFRQVPLPEDFRFPWKAFLAAADEHTALAFVTSPDNPSGFAPDADELEAVARELPPSCLLVLDEAYMDFARPAERYALLPRLERIPNAAVLRTFSKTYGLAGLRLGFGVLPEALCDYYWRVRLPFSVNVLAEEAGMAALADEAFLAATLETVAGGRQYLSDALAGLGCTVYPSQANFVMMRPPEGAPDAATLFEGLLREGIIVRHLKSFGLPGHLRVSVGTAAENEAFIEALQRLLAHA